MVFQGLFLWPLFSHASSFHNPYQCIGHAIAKKKLTQKYPNKNIVLHEVYINSGQTDDVYVTGVTPQSTAIKAIGIDLKGS